MKHWLGFVMDGRIRAIDEGSSSQYVDEIPVPWLGFENGELVINTWSFPSFPFYTMYVLAVIADLKNPPWDIYSLPDPLKSSLLRSSISKDKSARSYIQADFRSAL
jgi:hypothetical protein